jgi:hypothetical protein
LVFSPPPAFGGDFASNATQEWLKCANFGQPPSDAVEGLVCAFKRVATVIAAKEG